MQALPVKFQPIPTERIWGGHKLKSLFGVDSPEKIGEYWVLSGHPNGLSIVNEGPFKGKSLNELAAEYPLEYLGSSSPQSRFPLLIKFLEAADDLSIQIHPDDAYAQERENDFGKSEAWYVLDCRDDGCIVYGHRFPDRASYDQAIRENTIKDYLLYREIKPGDLVYVPARTLHALLAGTIVMEIQQTSDVTYRVYDWDRVDDKGNPRQLHTRQAGDVLQYGADNADQSSQPAVIAQGEGFIHTHLVSCPYFAIEHLSLNSCEQELTSGHMGNPDVLIVLKGRGELVYGSGKMPLCEGEVVLIPASISKYKLTSENSIEVVRTYY